MSRVFKLIIEDDEGKTTVVPLNRDDVTIGRMEGNTIRLMERNVSRRHARLSRTNGAVFIDDLNSFNGVKINGERIDRRIEIKEGDLVEIGDYHLALQTEDAHDHVALDDTAPPASLATTPMRAQAPGGAPPGATTVEQQVTADALPTVGREAGAQAAASAAPSPAAGLEGPDPLVTPPLRPSSLPPFPTAGLTSPSGLAAPTVPDTSLHAIQRGDVGISSPPTADLNRGPAHVTDYPRVICVSTEYAGREFPLNRPEVVIGRVEDNDIIIEHRSVSRNHAKIVLKNGVHKIIDLESANGILVNGEEYAITDLRRGDLIELGHVRFRYFPPGERFTPTAEEITAMLEAGVKPAPMELPERPSGPGLPSELEAGYSPLAASDPSNAQTVTDTPISALSAAYGSYDPSVESTTVPPSRPPDAVRPDSLTVRNPVSGRTQAAREKTEPSAGYQYASTSSGDFEDELTSEGGSRNKRLGAVAVLVVLGAFLLYVGAKFVGGGGSADQELQRLYQKGEWAQVEEHFKTNRAEFDDFDRAFRMATEARTHLDAASKVRQPVPPPEPEAPPEVPPEPLEVVEPAPPQPEPVEPEPVEPEPAEPSDARRPPAKVVKRPPPKAPPPAPPSASSKLQQAQLYEREGLQKMTFGDLAQAERLFKLCLKTADYPPCHRQLGILYASRDDTASSVRHYRRYVELSPKANDAARVREIIREATSGE